MNEQPQQNIPTDIVENPEVQASVQQTVDDVITGVTQSPGFEAPTPTPPQQKLHEAPTVPAVPNAPVQMGQPVQSADPNDEVRYQHWQSEHDKIKTERDNLYQQNQMMQQQMQMQMQQPQEAPQEVAPTMEEILPPPPQRPEKPSNYSREDLADPSSDASRYHDSLEAYRDDMQEYQSFQSEYQRAVMDEKMSEIEQQRAVDTQAAQQQQARQQFTANIAQEVKKANPDFTDAQIHDFLQKMGDQKSVTIDNLVQLYRLQTGMIPQAMPQANAPSQAFVQRQNAQQIPSPMGVMPATNQQVQPKRSVEDMIIDELENDYNSQNPFK